MDGGHNTYGYVYQNPFIYVDPFGLDVDLNLHRRVDNHGATPDYQNSSRINPPPGSLRVSGHGSPGSIDNRFEDSKLNAKQLAEKIKSLPNHDPNAPIYLYSCQTGSGANSLVQQLHNQLGNPVVAPTVDIIVDSKGNVLPSPNSWKTFK